MKPFWLIGKKTAEDVGTGSIQSKQEYVLRMALGGVGIISIAINTTRAIHAVIEGRFEKSWCFFTYAERARVWCPHIFIRDLSSPDDQRMMCSTVPLGPRQIVVYVDCSVTMRRAGLATANKM